jgi:uncharacterized protein
VHQDGLIHISEMSQVFVKDAKTVLTVGDVVKVRVLAVDVQNKRISLSMKQEVAEGTSGGQQRGQSQRGGYNNGGRDQQRGGGRDQRNGQAQGGYAGGGRDQHHGGKPPMQGHATIADLKAKLAGKSPVKEEKKNQPVKLQVSLAQLMKSGR